MLAGHGDSHHFTAGRPRVFLGFQLFLFGTDFILHLLDLAHHSVGIRAAVAFGQSCFHRNILQLLFIFNLNIDAQCLHVLQGLVNGHLRASVILIFWGFIRTDTAPNFGDTVDGFL